MLTCSHPFHTGERGIKKKSKRLDSRYKLDTKESRLRDVLDELLWIKQRRPIPRSLEIVGNDRLENFSAEDRILSSRKQGKTFPPEDAILP
jgi:hypothetical protein